MVDEKVVLKGIKVEYICIKRDAYENDLCYFKIVDKNFDSKFAVLIKDDFKYPWWRTENGKILIKVNKKYMKLKETVKDEPVVVELSFKYYKMNENVGYYVCSLV